MPFMVDPVCVCLYKTEQRFINNPSLITNNGFSCGDLFFDFKHERCKSYVSRKETSLYNVILPCTPFFCMNKLSKI